MPIIKLPDGKDLTFQSKVTGLEVAEKISKSLSKQALVVSVDGQLKDLTHTIERDCSLTNRSKITSSLVRFNSNTASI